MKSFVTLCATLAFTAAAQAAPFTLSSPDLAGGVFPNIHVLNGFGCKGGNVSPMLVWSGVPDGTRSLVLMVHDPDAPTGSGFWHWTVFDIPAGAKGLARGAGNSAATLPAGARGGVNDYQDTGAIGGNGNYGGPCPPAGETAHRYVFTLYALSVDHIAEAGGIPLTGTPALYGFVLNRGLGKAMLGKASFTARYGR
jgi:Raf kinase inhibitor-like YbhB/YbcL family protein